MSGPNLIDISEDFDDLDQAPVLLPDGRIVAPSEVPPGVFDFTSEDDSDEPEAE